MFSLFPEIRKFIPFYFIGKKTLKNVTIYLDRFGNKKSLYSVMLILSHFFFLCFFILYIAGSRTQNFKLKFCVKV